MSFFGKKFQKSHSEKMDELLDAVKAGEEVRKLLSGKDVVVFWTKNADGTITSSVESNGKVVMSYSFELGKEFELPILGGTVKVKNVFTLEGNTLKADVTYVNGKKVYMNRIFEDDKMKMTIKVEDVDIEAALHYKLVN